MRLAWRFTRESHWKDVATWSRLAILYSNLPDGNIHPSGTVAVNRECAGAGRLAPFDVIPACVVQAGHALA